MKKLVIVESPTKAKTISRFLGKEYSVASSYGHVRDLPKSTLGVDVEGSFEPKYIIPTKSRKNLNALKKSAEKADEIVLATDEDREGEAIAWHVAKALEVEKNKKPTERIIFHEITKKAILEALKNPRDINADLVNAQQARRVLDRLVGYKLSPLLWKKVMRGLSAGRVQSVALRFIVERERERDKFSPVEYWTIEALLKDGDGNEFTARIWKKDKKIIGDLDISNKKETDKIIADLKKTSWKTQDVQKKERKRNPLPPYTTSTLQQDSARRLRFSAKQTMRVAQQLYEGIKLDKGQEGLITYMRTDSFNLSSSARVSAERFIKDSFGQNYSYSRQYKTKQKSAQEAHEAIRPTDPKRTPESIKKYLDKSQLGLYSLVWERFVASQMAPAIFEATTIIVSTNTPYVFRASGLVKKFDGFLKVWKQDTKETILPNIKEGENIDLKKLIPERHETKPPPRYSEATLVKTLEEYGIGRPSTYAPTMSTIVTRRYVEKDNSRRFFPTEIGSVVNDLLVEHFPKIVDVSFTAKMEEDLDSVANGKKGWVPVVKDFYEPFAKELEKKEKEIKKSDIKKDKPTDKICPKCGKPIVLKLGRFGKFYACSGFPECKHTENFAEKVNMKCPECNKGDIIVKRTKKRRIFYGCSRWPECEFASWKNPKLGARSDNKKSI